MLQFSILVGLYIVISSMVQSAFLVQPVQSYSILQSPSFAKFRQVQLSSAPALPCSRTDWITWCAKLCWHRLPTSFSNSSIKSQVAPLPRNSWTNGRHKQIYIYITIYILLCICICICICVCICICICILYYIIICRLYCIIICLLYYIIICILYILYYFILYYIIIYYNMYILLYYILYYVYIILCYII